MTNISDKRDDPVEIAHQLYQKHGYQQALHTCIRHINSSDNYTERFKWENIAKELTSLCQNNPEISRTSLG
jgi:hypothetical protein